MHLLYETHRLKLDFWEAFKRLLLRGGWGLPTVSPAAMSLVRRATWISSGDSALDGASGHFRMGFRFQDDDQDSTDGGSWWPQGITGSADADPSGSIDGKKYLAVGWYARNHEVDDPAARVSLVDLSEGDVIPYRHILLVEPYQDEDGNYSFKPATTHAGGIVWYGRWLYVADSDTLLFFDMEAITDLKDQNKDYSTTTKMGYHVDEGTGRGVYHAGGYRYILPLVGRYSIVGSTRGNYFDTLSLDRTTDPHRLVCAGYVGAPGGKYDDDPEHSVVLFWDLSPTSGLLETVGDYVESSEAAFADELYVQGVSAAGSDVWLCRSSEVNELLACRIGYLNHTKYAWAAAGEGLTYAPASDHLWNVTEGRGSRICFCVRRDDVPR